MDELKRFVQKLDYMGSEHVDDIVRDALNHLRACLERIGGGTTGRTEKAIKEIEQLQALARLVNSNPPDYVPLLIGAFGFLAEEGWIARVRNNLETHTRRLALEPDYAEDVRLVVWSHAETRLLKADRR